jgi:hypothetical protein
VKSEERSRERTEGRNARSHLVRRTRQSNTRDQIARLASCGASTDCHRIRTFRRGLRAAEGARAGWRGCLTDNYYTGSMLGIGINSRYCPWRARTDASTRKQLEVAHVNVKVVSYLRKLNT